MADLAVAVPAPRHGIAAARIERGRLLSAALEKALSSAAGDATVGLA